MQVFFYVCFGVGVGYALLSFFLGQVLGALHLDADIGGGGGFDGIDGIDGIDGDVDAGGSVNGNISPIKPVVISAFLTVFGGMGILLMDYINIFAVVALSGLAGLVAGYLFHRFIITPLYRAQNTTAVEIRSLVGHDAVVTEGIPQGGYGKITYRVAGSTYTAPAKAEGGGAISRNTVTEIVFIEKNTYYVSAKTEQKLETKREQKNSD